jgi:hypothetical protein
MNTLIRQVPQDLIDEDPNKFIHWFTQTIKSNFSNEIDLFMEIRKSQRHESSIERLVTKKALIPGDQIQNYFNNLNLNTMKTIILLLVLSVSFIMKAQFDPTTGIKTETTITVENTKFEVMKTSNGSPYILCVSPTSGNSYAVWIGTATEKIHEGKQVRVSKSGKEFIILISDRTKNPYTKYIKNESSKAESKNN